MEGQPGPGLVWHVSCVRWETPLHRVGPTPGSSIWLALCGAVLLLRGHGPASAAFVAGFALLVAATWVWWRRERRSAYRAWLGWLAAFWAVSLAAIATSHVTNAHAAIGLDDVGLGWLYAGAELGVPLLMADTCCRERPDGRRGVLGALFDVLASSV